MFTRRQLLKILGSIPLLSLLKSSPALAIPSQKPKTTDQSVSVYRAVNGTPSQNMKKVIQLIGGIESFIEPEDIVVIKPNIQWWNQGAPNHEALYEFIKLIMERPGGFFGEVILAENCHRSDKPWDSKYAGWRQPSVRNTGLKGVKNYNELAQKLKQDFGDRYSTVHWINVKVGAKRVFSVQDGVGYVYCDGEGGVPEFSFNNGAKGENYRETIMTYPIFKTDRGTVVDYKNGIWENGKFDNSKLKVVNFAALNHHSTYCGFTSVIKNYLGVSDLSGGPDPFNDGKLTDKYYNFHSFPFNKWAPGPQPGMIGAEIGVFLSTIRKAAMNIVTAEWIGLADRLEPPVARTRAVLASTDPVALDFHSAKYVLYPNSMIRFHDPEPSDSPAHQYIKACSDHGGGVFDERHVALVSYDNEADRMQDDHEAAVIGKKIWGNDYKAIGKYLLMRYGAFLID
jgi:hypothetical protein